MGIKKVCKLAHAKCHVCGAEQKINVSPNDVRLNGNYRQRWFCRDCAKTRNKENRGRTIAEIVSLGEKNIDPVKVFSKKEIKAVAHLCTPPKLAKRGTYYRID